MSSLVARPCLIRAHWPTQLFGLVPQKGMTTLAAPRSLKTSVTSVCHARVDNKLYPCRLGAKIQGQLHEEVDNVPFAHIFGDHLANFSTQIFGQRRVRIGQRLVLADQTAKLGGEGF